MTEKKQEYSSVSDVLGAVAKGPRVLQEDYEDPETGLKFRIEGVPKWRDRIALWERITDLQTRIKDGKLIVLDAEKESFTPTPMDVQMAVFASVCVKEPKIGEMQWLAIGGSSGLLGRVYMRCLVCNREIEEGTLKNALQEAVGVLDDNPLSPNGSDSA